MLVDMTLEELEGVASAQTDLASAESLVTFDSEIVSLDGLVDAVRKVGYDAEVVG
jgi:copper chaperone CopZ